MDGPFGWTGRVLQIDLSVGRSSVIPTQNFEPENFLGGIGLNARTFWNQGCPSVQALDPLRPMMISSGPLAALPGPFGRGHICGIAPTIPEEAFSYSGFGGKWPSELKYAEFHGIIVWGRADDPVCMAIEDQTVQIHPAVDLWGLGTLDTQGIIVRRFPGASMLCFRPAGEKFSCNAVVATETGNTAGQGGLGEVLGSRNLKAIAVRGTGEVGIRRPDEFRRLMVDRKADGDSLRGRQGLCAPIFGGAVKTVMAERHRKMPCGRYAFPYRCTSF